MNETLKMSEEGLELTKASEGLRLEAYPDPGSGGAPFTCGYGHTGPDVHEGLKINKAQADRWLVEDIAWAENAVRSLVKIPLTQNQFDALVDFVFNVGNSNFTRSTLLRKLNSGDIAGASREFMRWTTASGKILPGLIRRRDAETALFEKEEW